MHHDAGDKSKEKDFVPGDSEMVLKMREKMNSVDKEIPFVFLTIIGCTFLVFSLHFLDSQWGGGDLQCLAIDFHSVNGRKGL